MSICNKGFVIGCFCALLLGADGRQRASNNQQCNGMTPFINESTLKDYRKDAAWKQIACDKCKGTGSIVFSLYGPNNTVKKVLSPCPKCNGRGVIGISKM